MDSRPFSDAACERFGSGECMVATINYAQDSFAVVVDKKHDVYLQNMTVDYVRKGLNEGFEFVNPNERDRCGCGESFRV